MQNPNDNRNRKRGNDRDRAQRLALGGMLAALALLFLFISSVSPTADLALMTLASLCVAIAVIEHGFGGALLLYVVISLLSVGWPGIAFSWPFIGFFGIFPLVKSFAERRWPRLPAAIFKLTVSAALMLVATLLFGIPMLHDLASRYGGWVVPTILFGGLAVILVYDYALTLLITLYVNRRPRR